MAGPKQFLGHAYETDSSEEIHALYKDWADSYDRELRDNGYVAPDRVAAAMASHVSSLDDPLLDIGCGTGLSGEALKAAGFTRVDGTDFSDEMLAVAGTKDIYGRLLKGNIDRPFPVEPGDYLNATATGVLSRGHALPEMIEAVVALLPAGGCFGFTLNDTALADGSYEARIREIVDSGAAQILSDEYGEHLPGMNLKAKIYVLRSC